MKAKTDVQNGADTALAAAALQAFDASMIGGKNRPGNGKNYGNNNNYGNRNNGYGNGNGNGYGRDGQGSRYNKGRGDGNRQSHNCEDASSCFKPLPGQTKKGALSTDVVPIANTSAVMDHNLKVAQKNIDWLNLALTGVNVKVLEKCRNNATMCVPRGAERRVNEILLIEKSLRASINDVVMQVKEMSMSLNVDPHAFTDQYSKIVTDPDIMTKLLLDGHLNYGGTILQGVLYTENSNFRLRILQENQADADPGFNRLTYGSVDHLFAVTYETDKGSYDVVFGIGLDGRAVQPHIDTNGESRDIDLLTPVDASEFFRRAASGVDSSHSQLRSRSRKKSVSTRS